jgi:hypothetical protein
MSWLRCGELANQVNTQQNNLEIGSREQGCYNQTMLKDDEDERPSKDDEEKDNRYQNDDLTAKDRKAKDRSDSAARNKKSRGADDSDPPDGSEVKLDPVRPKIPESGDQLKKRAEYFKKRH